MTGLVGWRVCCDRGGAWANKATVFSLYFFSTFQVVLGPGRFLGSLFHWEELEWTWAVWGWSLEQGGALSDAEHISGGRGRCRSQVGRSASSVA